MRILIRTFVRAGVAQFVVEMQKRTQRYFRDRALYYAAYPIIEQAPKGSWNYRLKPVCVVGILNFAMEHEYGRKQGLPRVKLKAGLTARPRSPGRCWRRGCRRSR